MNVSHILSFDDALHAALSLCGVGTGTLALIGAAQALKSWYDFGHTVVHRTRQARVLARGTVTALGRLSPVRVIVAAIVTVLVAAGQALTVLSCFVVGNYLSALLQDTFTHHPTVVITTMKDSYPLFEPGYVLGSLQLDIVTAIYMLIALGVVWASYVSASRDDVDRGYGRYQTGGTISPMGLADYRLPRSQTEAGARGISSIVLTAPALVTIVIFGIGTSFDSASAVPLGLAALAAVVFYAACRASVHGSRLVARLWASAAGP